MKNLKFLFVFCLTTIFFSSILVNAQDVITKRNGDEINAKVLEEKESGEVKYKRLDNPDGPTYSIDKSELSKIIYANGKEENFGMDNLAGQNANAPVNNPEKEAIGYSSESAPPALPVYVQPACPVEGYIWTPGYWAFSVMRGFFWVPGVWVAAAQPGYLWTPGYWGWEDGHYRWNEGYWGEHVGYYGGISYGYGYGGSGYYGGRWEGERFHYNTAVSNVSTTEVHNTYIDKTVIVTTVNKASYNGPGGYTVKPTENERMAMNENHIKPASDQLSHRQMASKDESQYNSVNHGHPATASMDKINGQAYDPHMQHSKLNTESTHTSNSLNPPKQQSSTPQPKTVTPVNKVNPNIPNNSTQGQTRTNPQTQQRTTTQQSGTPQMRSGNNTTKAPQYKTVYVCPKCGAYGTKGGKCPKCKMPYGAKTFKV